MDKVNPLRDPETYHYTTRSLHARLTIYTKRWTVFTNRFSHETVCALFIRFGHSLIKNNLFKDVKKQNKKQNRQPLKSALVSDGNSKLQLYFLVRHIPGTCINKIIEIIVFTTSSQEFFLIFTVLSIVVASYKLTWFKYSCN